MLFRSVKNVFCGSVEIRWALGLSMMYNDMPENLVSICDRINRDSYFLM